MVDGYNRQGTIRTGRRQLDSEDQIEESEWNNPAETNNVEVNSGVAELQPPVPESEIYHEWHADEGSGSTLADAEGSLDGTLNGPDWVSGDWVGGSALDFVAGDGDYVSFPNTIPEIDVRQSVEFVIALTADSFRDDNEGIWVVQHVSGDGPDQVSFGTTSEGNDSVFAGVYDGSWHTVGVSFADLPSSGPVRFFFVYRGNSSMDLYWNVDNSNTQELSGGTGAGSPSEGFGFGAAPIGASSSDPTAVLDAPVIRAAPDDPGDDELLAQADYDEHAQPWNGSGNEDGGTVMTEQQSLDGTTLNSDTL